jgi:late competence protein required for DNA uptake (superfamily II DNA/RNA helicase)
MDEETNSKIKQHILEYLDRQESFVIHTVKGTSLPEDLYQATSNLLQEAGESWEDYIPALQFA